MRSDLLCRERTGLLGKEFEQTCFGRGKTGNCSCFDHRASYASDAPWYAERLFRTISEKNRERKPTGPSDAVIVPKRPEDMSVPRENLSEYRFGKAGWKGPDLCSDLCSLWEQIHSPTFRHRQTGSRRKI